MESLPTSPEVTYNWVDITSDFFKHIQGKQQQEITTFNPLILAHFNKLLGCKTEPLLRD